MEPVAVNLTEIFLIPLSRARARLIVQRPEPFRRCGFSFVVQVLVRALAVGDLLQPVPRASGIFRQAPGAFEERFAKTIRADVRAELRRLGHHGGRGRGRGRGGVALIRRGVALGF